MRRIAAWTLALVLLLLPLSSALAEQYTDAENQLAVNIPDNNSTLLYSGEAAYLPDDMQDLAVAEDLDPRLRVRSYTPDDLIGYTLDVITCPLAALDPQDAAAGAPASPAAAYTDISESAARESAVALAQDMFSGRFDLSAAVPGTFHGISDLELSGTGRMDTHWSEYSLDVILLTNTQRLVIIAAAYLDSEREAVEAVLADMSVGGESPDAQPAETPPATTEAAATVRPSDLPAAAERTAPAQPGWWTAFRSWTARYPNLIYYALLAAAAILGIVGIAVSVRSARQRRWIREDEDDRAGILTTREGPSRRSGRHTTKEDKMGESEQPFGTGRPEYDYAEDISRYTQQPSADVNDVSRYTHGYDNDDGLSDELRALQDEPLVTPPAVKIQSVGSRVERNRRRKRK